MRFVRGFLGSVWGVGNGGGNSGGLFDLHLSGSLCITALDVGSLFNRVAYLLMLRSAWCFSGGIDPSTSIVLYLAGVLYAMLALYNAG